MPHTQPKLNQNKLSTTWDIMSLSRGKTLEMPENTEFLGGVVADWLQKSVINLLSE